MFGVIHCIYHINRSIATNIEFQIFGILTSSTQRIIFILYYILCFVTIGVRKPVTFRSQGPTLSRYTTHVLQLILREIYFKRSN